MAVESKRYLVLDRYYTKEKLENGWLHWAKSFIVHNEFVLAKMGKQGVGLDIIELSKKKQNLPRQELFNVSFCPLNNMEVFDMFLKHLPEAVSKLLKALIWERTMTLKEASAITGYSILHAPKDSWSPPVLLKGYDMFVLADQRYGASIEKNHIFLPIELLEMIRPYMPKPKYYTLEGLDEIGPTEYSFNAEESIMTDIPKIISYKQQGLIKYSSSGYTATDASLVKIQKICNIQEFLPLEFEASSRIRTSLLVGLTNNVVYEELGLDTHKLIKDLFNKTYLESYPFYYILSYIKGLAKLFPMHEAEKGPEIAFVETIKLLPSGKWIAFENFQKYLTYRNKDTKPITTSAAAHKLYISISSEDDDYEPEKQNIDPSLYKEYVETPFLLGSFYLYASFGLMEITYNPNKNHISKKPTPNIYPRIAYFRLTDLGRYVWGLSRSYKPKLNEKQGSLVFSDTSLIITIEGELDIADVLLGNYAEKIATKKYRVTQSTFLKDCKTIGDINKKTALFKKTIIENPPSNWEVFFNDIAFRSQSVKQDSDYVVFTLNERDKDLQRLVAQDQVLKEIVLKAEKFNILVKTANLPKFRNRLKDMGYLVEQ